MTAPGGRESTWLRNVSISMRQPSYRWMMQAAGEATDPSEHGSVADWPHRRRLLLRRIAHGLPQTSSRGEGWGRPLRLCIASLRISFPGFGRRWCSRLRLEHHQDLERQTVSSLKLLYRTGTSRSLAPSASRGCPRCRPPRGASSAGAPPQNLRHRPATCPSTVQG